MDIIDAIRARRTIGKSSGEVARDTVLELIEAATWAPNHKLTQPWRFTVVDGSAREELGRIWARRASAVVEASARAAFIAGESAKPLRAPTLVVVSVRTDANPVTAEEDFAATAAAVQNLLLAAHAKGLSAAWKTGKMIYDVVVKSFLSLDPPDRIVAIVYLGATALEEAAPRERDTHNCVHWIPELASAVAD
jgi:nitroreductase